MRRIRYLLPALTLALTLAGCAQKPATTTIFAMNTVMTLSAYGDGAQDAVALATDRIYELERLFSVTDPDSELSAANRADGGWVPLSPDTGALLSFALSMSDRTGGALDPTVYPVLRAWGFTTGTYQIPSQQELEALLPRVDHRAVELAPDGSRLRLPQGMELDLGSVAKGYTGDQLAALFAREAVDCALLDLGGNIQAIGEKPDGSPWRIGIRDPAGDESAYLASVAVKNQAVVTSGGYQRFFQADGQTYWHILDPSTGQPARSGLTSVTVVGDSGALCDALSTALFVMGPDRAAQHWREHRDFEAVLVTEDGSILVTGGLADRFTLAPGYEGREVTVIQP